ncbi:hypothetical protein GS4_04_00415 [Gordonia soli NBRC 108243]|uniref:DJ-1/PfpI domain-containing protein n=1 Tax=Gordonia soli NBRC 108243 TaxID=1223545 RepID=M0QDY5_9ACTN|nr:hypothetical protein GS4_04_00415 [Gordonia soli NBRC 108243]
MTQIAFVTYPGVTALDLVGPYEVLRHLPDADIRFVWRETGPIATDSNVLLLGATHTFGETPNPDIVVVPGGTPTVAVQARDQELLEWLRASISHCGSSHVSPARIVPRQYSSPSSTTRSRRSTRAARSRPHRR